MDFIIGIFIFMGGSIMILLSANKKLRTKNKIKDLEIQDVKLQSEQDNLKKEKNKLKDSLKNISIDGNLTDNQIEDYWKKRK